MNENSSFPANAESVLVYLQGKKADRDAEGRKGNYIKEIKKEKTSGNRERKCGYDA